MANNGIYYSSGNSLNFTTNSTTWATLGSGGTFVIDTVSGGTYLNLPVSGITAGTGIGVSNSNGNYTISYTGSTGTSGDYLPLSGGTVTGGTIFTSGVTANTLSSIDYIDFDLLSGGTAASSVSRLRYVADEGGLVTTLLGGNVDLQIGQQNVVFCYNGDTVNLTKGQVVAIFGNQGNRPKIQRAIASAETTSSTALGVVSETINIGNEGFVTTFGNVRGFNLTGITPGSYLYLSPTVLGGVTGTQPQAPDHIVAIGYVVRTGTTQGEVFVNINNGWELNELHNVRITNPSQYDILQYSAGTYPVWYNTSSPFFSGLTATTISAATYQNLPYSGTVVGTGTTNYVPVWTGSTGIGNSIIRANSTNVSINTSIDSNVLLSLYTTGATGVNSRGDSYGVYGIADSSSGFGVYGYNISTGGGGAGVYGSMANGTGVRGEVSGEFGANIGVQGIAAGINGGTPINIGGFFYAYADGTNYSVVLQDGTEDVGKVLVSQTADGKANWSGELNITGVTATTISAATYQNLPVSAITSSTYITATPVDGNYTIALTGPLLSYYVSGSTPGGTQVSGDRWLDTNTGDELVWVDDGDSQQWIQISSVVGGGGTGGGIIYIASSNAAFLSDGNVYIGSSLGGWSYYDWDITDSGYNYGRVHVAIPITENIPDGKTIKICVVGGGTSGLMRVYLHKISCNDLNTLNFISRSDLQNFDGTNNVCFNWSYTLLSGQGFTSCTDFIVLGFQGSGTYDTIRLSYTITAS